MPENSNNNRQTYEKWALYFKYFFECINQILLPSIHPTNKSRVDQSKSTNLNKNV